MTDCNNFHGVVPPLGQNGTLAEQRGAGNVARKVVSRGAGISDVACPPSVGSEKSILKFHGEPQLKRDTMTKQQAMAMAAKRWGKYAMIQFRRTGANAAQRAAASRRWHELQALKPVRPNLGIDKESPIWVEWRAAHAAWKREEDKACSLSLSYRYSVGSVEMGLFFFVQGQGDSWEEAFTKAGAR